MPISSRFTRSYAPALLLAAMLAAIPAGDFQAAAGSPFTLIAGTPKTLTPAALTAARKTETKSYVSADKKTLTFRQKSVRLVAMTGPDTDMLSYRIGGLRNPTLVVPHGAVIKLLFVNTDEDMFHNIRFGVARETYPNGMTPSLNTSVGTPELPHKSEIALHGEEMTLRTPLVPGLYNYFCTVRGHAQGGMVGKVIVK